VGVSKKKWVWAFLLINSLYEKKKGFLSIHGKISEKSWVEIVSNEYRYYNYPGVSVSIILIYVIHKLKIEFDSNICFISIKSPMEVPKEVDMWYHLMASMTRASPAF
jgi:hypothetical protein